MSLTSFLTHLVSQSVTHQGLYKRGEGKYHTIKENLRRKYWISELEISIINSPTKVNVGISTLPSFIGSPLPQEVVQLFIRYKKQTSNEHLVQWRMQCTLFGREMAGSAMTCNIIPSQSCRYHSFELLHVPTWIAELQLKWKIDSYEVTNQICLIDSTQKTTLTNNNLRRQSVPRHLDMEHRWLPSHLLGLHIRHMSAAGWPKCRRRLPSNPNGQSEGRASWVHILTALVLPTWM